MKNFDKEYVYDEQIAPLMTKIIEICQTHEIPALCSFVFAHGRGDDDGDDFCTTHLPGPYKEFNGEFSEAMAIVRKGSQHRATAFAITLTPTKTTVQKL